MKKELTACSPQDREVPLLFFQTGSPGSKPLPSAIAGYGDPSQTQQGLKQWDPPISHSLTQGHFHSSIFKLSQSS